jgi:hypothetical protein
VTDHPNRRPTIVAPRHLLPGDLIRLGGREGTVIAVLDRHPNPMLADKSLIIWMTDDEYGSELYFDQADPLDNFCALLYELGDRVEKARQRWAEKVPYSIDLRRLEANQ